MKKSVVIIGILLAVVLGFMSDPYIFGGPADGAQVYCETSVNGENLELRKEDGRDEAQLIGDELVTNTAEIAVVAENMGEGSRVRLYLYDARYEEPIMETALAAGKEYALFTNLTSAARYRLGAVTEGEEDVALTISDRLPAMLDMIEKIREWF